MPFLLAGGNPNWTPRQWQPIERAKDPKQQHRTDFPPIERQPTNLMGKVFDHLTVIGRDMKKRGTYWLARCTCGTVVSHTHENIQKPTVGPRRCDFRKPH